jgi:hypothetical protein
VSLLNALVYLDRGWFPHDLGSVAHPAQRVLLGELPHRDFQDVYTGGLAFLNALAFRALGPSAMSARWVALAVYALWIPAVWAIARRVAGGNGRWIAALTTLLAGAWTLPMYAEGMPSWYNLFLATFALLALIRYRESGRRRFLFWAGLAAGGSVLFKVVGLYAVAAGLLSLAWMEDRPARSEPGGDPAPARGPDAAYRWFVAACALSLAGLVVGLVSRAMGPGGLVRFALPALAAPLAMAWSVRRPAGVPSAVRFGRLVRLAVPFAAGVLSAVLPLILVYAAAGALGDLYEGVFVLPRRRLADASWGGLRGGLVGMSVAGVWVAWVAWLPRVAGRGRRVTGVVAAVAGFVALLLSGRDVVYHTLWQALWWLPPFVAAAGFLMISAADRGEGADTGKKVGGAAPFLVLAMFGMVSLVEVPFAAPIYFFYAAPLLALLALALAGRPAQAGSGTPAIGPRSVWVGGTAVLLLGFTVLRLDPGFVRYLGLQPTRHDQTQTLEIPRGGGLRVDAQARREIEEVVGLVDALAGGPYIFAGPDAPELYVLTGTRNPTPILFEFLDPDPATRDRRVLDALDAHQVNLVVINRRPFFSGPVSDALVAGLQERYPVAREVGRFLVVWRTPTPSRPRQP